MPGERPPAAADPRGRPGAEHDTIIYASRLVARPICETYHSSFEQPTVSCCMNGLAKHYSYRLSNQASWSTVNIETAAITELEYWIALKPDKDHVERICRVRCLCAHTHGHTPGPGGGHTAVS
jgi:hypothetical protein